MTMTDRAVRRGGRSVVRSGRPATSSADTSGIGRRRLQGRMRRRLTGVVAAAALLAPLGIATRADAAQSSVPAFQSTIGQPTLADRTLATRCAGANARFNFLNN